jgi:DNA polymerase-3 subunit alpha
MKAVDVAMESARRYQEHRATGQESLFGEPDDGAAGEAAPEEALPQAEPWTDRELLAYEKETLGFYVTGHPLQEYRSLLEEFRSRSTGTLAEAAATEGEATVGGMISGLRPRKTRKGDWMAVFTLEDLEGTVETLVFPETYKSCRDLLADELPVFVKGKVESDEGRTRLLASEIVPMKEARQRQAEAILIRITTPGVVERDVQELFELLQRSRGGCRVYLELVRPERFRATLKADPGLRVAPTADLTAAIERLVGPGSVRVQVRGL